MEEEAGGNIANVARAVPQDVVQSSFVLQVRLLLGLATSTTVLSWVSEKSSVLDCNTHTSQTLPVTSSVGFPLRLISKQLFPGDLLPWECQQGGSSSFFISLSALSS